MVWSFSIRILVLLFCVSFFSCNKPTPEECFGIAVLSSNMLVDFSNGGLERELKSPLVKMGKTKDEVIPMKRAELIDTRIGFVEENYEKLKGFEQTDDNKDIIQNSMALHEMILPVYKNEYTQLAKLYDEYGSKEKIEELEKAIHDKYSLKFDELYNKLIGSGKFFAKKHDIKVNWPE